MADCRLFVCLFSFFLSFFRAAFFISFIQPRFLPCWIRRSRFRCHPQDRCRSTRPQRPLHPNQALVLNRWIDFGQWAVPVINHIQRFWVWIVNDNDPQSQFRGTYPARRALRNSSLLSVEWPVLSKPWLIGEWFEQTRCHIWQLIHSRENTWK